MEKDKNLPTKFVQVQILDLSIGPEGVLTWMVVSYTNKVQRGWTVQTTNGLYQLGTIGDQVSHGSLLGYEVNIGSTAFGSATRNLNIGTTLNVVVPSN